MRHYSVYFIDNIGQDKYIGRWANTVEEAAKDMLETYCAEQIRYIIDTTDLDDLTSYHLVNGQWIKKG